MERMLLSKRAALFFDKKFKMYINGSNIRRQDRRKPALP